MASSLKVGPMFPWPRFPEFPDRFYDPAKVKAIEIPPIGTFTIWTVFTPGRTCRSGALLDDEATAQLASLLPDRLQRDPARWSGINLGTFNGTFQKAWMRRGYTMAGIELAEGTADELHAYGCEGHTDSIYDSSTIAAGRFDFGVLDRVLCQKPFYDDRAERSANSTTRRWLSRASAVS